MKFGRYWKTEVAKLPWILAKSCISYKKYKKNTNTKIAEIESECSAVDLVFKKYYHRLSNKTCFFSSVSKDELRQFADLNSMCLYKICKRLAKRYGIDTMTWLEHARSAHLYDFLSGSKTASLHIELPVECPICLEMVKQVYISRCGHFMCLDCVGSIYHMKGRRGTLMNLIHYDELTCEIKYCHICREKSPYANHSRLWPDNHKNFIYSKC